MSKSRFLYEIPFQCSKKSQEKKMRCKPFRLFLSLFQAWPNFPSEPISTLFFDLLITNCFERRRSRLVSFSIEQCTLAFRIQRRKKKNLRRHPEMSSYCPKKKEEGKGKITDQMLRKEDFSLPLRHFGERRTKKVKLSVCQNVYNKDIFREKKKYTHISSSLRNSSFSSARSIPAN